MENKIIVYHGSQEIISKRHLEKANFTMILG